MAQIRGVSWVGVASEAGLADLGGVRGSLQRRRALGDRLVWGVTFVPPGLDAPPLTGSVI